MQITSGRFEGRILNFFNTNLYVFGHHLRQASLMYNIKPDDEFKILIQGGDMELEIGDSGLVPNVEVAYLGLVGIKSPIKPGKNENKCYFSWV